MGPVGQEWAEDWPAGGRGKGAPLTWSQAEVTGCEHASPLQERLETGPRGARDPEQGLHQVGQLDPEAGLLDAPLGTAQSGVWGLGGRQVWEGQSCSCTHREGPAQPPKAPRSQPDPDFRPQPPQKGVVCVSVCPQAVAWQAQGSGREGSWGH